MTSPLGDGKGFTDDDLKRLEERMNRLVTLWDQERKDHFQKCRTLDIAFSEATKVFNDLMPLLARLEAAEECKNTLQMVLELIPRTYVTEIKQVERAIEVWREACGR